jgi:OOP family OmpA-OmpF porin
MANVIYDFMPNSSWRPFIGAGLGTAWVHNKVFGQLSSVPPGAASFQNTSFDDVDQALAWQGILGVAWDFAPNWSLDLTGRYLQTDDLQWGSVTTNAGGPGQFGAVTDVGTFEGKYKDTSVTLGIRYTFGSPPPPPPPPPRRRRRLRPRKRLRPRRRRRRLRPTRRVSSWSTSRSISTS